VSKVVVTGLGLVTGLGHTTPTWQGLLRGQVSSGGVADLPKDHRSPALAAKAAQLALVDSGLNLPQPELGIVFGTSRGQLGDLERYRQTGLPSWLDAQASGGALAVAQALGSGNLYGVPALACSSGAWAVGWGLRLIQWGYCGRVLCGASDAPRTPLGEVGFRQMGLQATTPYLQPFNALATGLVLGEGAAALVLERADWARARGARVYGAVTGFGHTNDAWHPCTPDPAGTQALRAVGLCLEEMGIAQTAVDYLNTHGTGTRLNDAGEYRLIQRAYGPGVWVGATKGATGHCLGATGAMEAAFCLLALYHQYLPASPGLGTGYDLNFVRSSQLQPLTYAVSHSFGFGGQNVVLGFQRDDN